MARMAVSMELRFQHALEALAEAAASWPQERRDSFVSDWRKLEIAGARMLDTDFQYGRLIAYPSDDYMRHLKAYGVHLW